MPYKDKDDQRLYQKRTATPYMRKWREANREKVRKYMREWKRKRHSDPDKKQADIKKSIESGAKKRGYINQQRKFKTDRKTLSDNYIAFLIAYRSRTLRMQMQLVKESPELIELHRQLLITKRKLKQNDSNCKQLNGYAPSIKRKLGWIANWEKKASDCKRG